MRKTIVFSALAALIGLAAAAQASENPRTDTQANRTTSEQIRHGHEGKHEREARNERRHERHDEASEKRDRKDVHHKEHEATEHPNRR